MFKDLIKIGLSERQAEVYMAVLKMGETTMKPLEDELGLHKQTIYNCLDDLIKIGLIEEDSEKKRRSFRATDPEILWQQNKARGTVIENLIPKIHAQSGIYKIIGQVGVYHGRKAFQAFLQRMLKTIPKESNVAVIGAGGDEFLKIVRQKYFFDRYENLRIHKKISHQLLMYENQRDTSPEYTQRKYVKVKFLPETFHQPMSAPIWPTCVSILLFDQQPQVFEVKSKKIRDGFKNYFDVLWKMGKA